MKHPCLLKNTQGHDYIKLLLKVQMLQNLDVPSDLKKQIKN